MNFKNFYLIESESQKFQIPPKIAKNYKIDGDFSNIKNWKAKIMTGWGAGGNDKIGDFVDVFYVLIDLNSNFIIPVSRGDEHRTGYEFYYDYLLKKKLVPEGNYESINCYPGSSHYVYYSASSKDKEDQKKVKDEIAALKKFLDYGGSKDHKVRGMNADYLGDVEDYLARQGNITIGKGELAKTGKYIVDSLEYIAKEYKRFDQIETNHRDIREGDIIDLFTFTKNFLKKFLDYNGIIYNLNTSYNDKQKKYLNEERIKDWIKGLEGEEPKLKWRYLANVVLSGNGLKNNLHALLKLVDQENKRNKRTNSYFESIFGDIETAIQEFNRLAQL